MQNAFNILNPVNKIQIVNLSPCEITITNFNVNLLLKEKVNLNYELLDNEINLLGNCGQKLNLNKMFNITKENSPKLMVLTLENDEIILKSFSYDIENYKIGSSRISFVNLVNNNTDIFAPILNDKEYGNIANTFDVDYDQYNLKIRYLGDKIYEAGNYLFETCGKYTFFIFKNNEGYLDSLFFTEIHSNGLHIAWQLIQVILMAIAEILFAISGSTFAYFIAPESMRSILQALWLLTRALGNVIIIIVAKAKLVQNQAYEYLAFAGLLLISNIVFVTLICLINYDENCEKIEDNT